jgi:hypothetical protein
MATRMQQRRGTAAQWTSTNAGAGPVLNAGEIGWESDTNRFKIGDGVNNWSNLDYFADINSTVNPAFGSSITFEGTTANNFETILSVTDPTADRTITFPDATGTVVLSDGSGNVTVSGDLTVTGTTTTINSTTINATTGIVFEGATTNDFETTLTVTDPTADRTVTFQDATGTVVLRDSTDTLTNKTLTSPTVSGLTLSDSSIVIEGSTANDFETTLSVTNPTEDRTITFPDATGTVALAEDVSLSLGSYVLTEDIGAVDGVAGLDGSKNLLVPGTKIIFEGTANDFETEFVVTDPAADVVLTFPNATGTIALTSDITVSASSTNTFSNKSISLTSNPVTGTLAEFNTALSDADFATIAGTETLTNKTLTTPTINGPTITATGQTPTIHGIYLPAPHNIIFEGTTANDFETTLEPGEPTADRTITLPDATGTVQLRVTDVSDTEIGYLNGVTSAIQTQMDAKAPLAAPAFTGTATAVNLTISGDLTVNGTTTNLNSTNLVVEDKNIVLGDTTSPTDTTADGGGITLKGATDKTFNWVDTTDAWTSSEHINLASGKTLKYNGTDLVAAQSGNSGKYLTTDGTTTSWGTVTGYSAPTLGSTSIASGATVTNVAGLTINSTTIPTSKTLVVTTDKLNVHAATTSAELAGVISDETGSGSLVFGTSPTITPAEGTTTIAAIGAGYMGLPQNSTTTGAYTVAAADAGKHIYSTATRTVTINSNAGLALPIGTAVTFISGPGATTTIAITTDTMYLAGAGTTGSRTLAAHGMATAVKVAATTWYISGNGLT